jgi:hypothetical protein
VLVAGQRGGHRGGDRRQRRQLVHRRGRRFGDEGGRRAGRLGRHVLVDVDETGVYEGRDDRAGLEEREAAVAGQLGQGPLVVDLAEQGPGVGVEHDVGRGRSTGRQDGYGGWAVYHPDDPVPGLVALGHLVQQLGDGDRLRDVLAGFLILAEAELAGRPAHEIGHGVAQLLGDERLDHGLLDEAEVDEQLPEPPSLQLRPLGFEGLGERLGRELSGGDEPGTERGSPPRDGHRVHEAGLEVDQCLVAGGVDHMEAAGEAFDGQLAEQGGQGG